jgi:hypothetical protein
MDIGVNTALLPRSVFISKMTGRNDKNLSEKSYKLNLTTHHSSTLRKCPHLCKSFVVPLLHILLDKSLFDDFL